MLEGKKNSPEIFLKLYFTSITVVFKAGQTQLFCLLMGISR